MLKKIMALAIAAVGVASHSTAGELSEAHITALVRDLSGNDASAVKVTREALHGKFAAGDYYVDLIDDAPVFAAIASGLTRSGHLEALDWAEGLSPSAEAFERLFRKAGLDPAKPLAELKEATVEERGDAVGFVYAAFRPLADAAGMRILGLNSNSDSYHFVLVPEAVAKRWVNVKFGDNQYVEDGDWQFLSMVKAAGLTPRSTEHPAGSEQAPPALP